MSDKAKSCGGTDYATYLLIDDLLALQRPLTPSSHDELLFIVVHQVYELWFKLILRELNAARDQLSAAKPQSALGPLRRITAVERLLLEQLNVLETMGPEGFLEFRDPLEPASGFQSHQFRKIEWISGLRGHQQELYGKDDKPSLYEAFCSCASALGLNMPTDDGPEAAELRVASLTDLYRDHLADPHRTLLHIVAELLVDHDESMARWRFHHTLMAAREIGARPGTGGSRGVDYLKSTLDQRFFPDLWSVRTAL